MKEGKTYKLLKKIYLESEDDLFNIHKEILIRISNGEKIEYIYDVDGDLIYIFEEVE